MGKPLQRTPILPEQAITRLHQAKQEIIEAARARVPERLAAATALAAVRLARREASPGDVLSDRVCALVRASLKALAQGKWKPDTALLLQKRREEGGHERSR
jgi:hypothetical protein